MKRILKQMFKFCFKKRYRNLPPGNQHFQVENNFKK